jgi:hypothetical protein
MACTRQFPSTHYIPVLIIITVTISSHAHPAVLRIPNTRNIPIKSSTHGQYSHGNVVMKILTQEAIHVQDTHKQGLRIAAAILRQSDELLCKKQTVEPPCRQTLESCIYDTFKLDSSDMVPLERNETKYIKMKTWDMHGKGSCNALRKLRHKPESCMQDTFELGTSELAPRRREEQLSTRHVHAEPCIYDMYEPENSDIKSAFLGVKKIHKSPTWPLNRASLQCFGSLSLRGGFDSSFGGKASWPLRLRGGFDSSFGGKASWPLRLRGGFWFEPWHMFGNFSGVCVCMYIRMYVCMYA